MEERIYYVGVAAAVADGDKEAPRGANVIVHVYVRALDETYAGAAASEICSERGLVFRSFTYLPSEETTDSLLQGDEHLAAFEHANRYGVAYVLAFIYDQAHHLIQMPKKK